MNTQRPPLPPFTLETARPPKDERNSRAPEKVAPAYGVDSYWRNPAEFVQAA